jgi:hypothetical protein
METYIHVSLRQAAIMAQKKPDRPDREPAKVDLMKFHRGKVSCL